MDHPSRREGVLRPSSSPIARPGTPQLPPSPAAPPGGGPQASIWVLRRDIHGPGPSRSPRNNRDKFDLYLLHRLSIGPDGKRVRRRGPQAVMRHERARQTGGPGAQRLACLMGHEIPAGGFPNGGIFLEAGPAELDVEFTSERPEAAEGGGGGLGGGRRGRRQEARAARARGGGDGEGERCGPARVPRGAAGVPGCAGRPRGGAGRAVPVRCPD